MHSCRKTIFLVLLCFYLDSSHTVPTFGNEYVHIKVHVPNEISHKHIYHEVLHEPEFHTPTPKVIHHYHRRRRRPTKKDHLQQQLHNEHDALLGSLVLSETKTPITGDHLEYLQHADEIANNLVKPIIKEAPRKKINTYRVIEETKQLPESETLDPHSHNHWKNSAVETFRIVEAKAPPKHVDTYRIIETKEPASHRPTNTFTETFKFIEDTYPHKSHAEIDAYPPSTQIEYEEQTGGGDDYHLAHEPHTKTLKIVETKVPRGERYRGHDHVIAPHTETIEVIETKVTKPKRFFHRRPYGGSALNTAAWQGHIYDDSDTEFYRPPAVTYLPPKHTYPPAKESYAPARHKHLPSRDTHPPLVESYLPSNRHADFHQTRQNFVYEDDYRPGDGIVEEVAGADGVGKKYLPPSVLDAADAHDYSHDGAVETYTGFDSYAAEHVQGVGSGGYRYS